MKFIDLYDGREYTVADLKSDWAQFREEDPDNHAAAGERPPLPSCGWSRWPWPCGTWSRPCY